jgi:hypothetical protein
MQTITEANSEENMKTEADIEIFIYAAEADRCIDTNRW